jgi:hypothetical protein
MDTSGSDDRTACTWRRPPAALLGGVLAVVGVLAAFTAG